MQKPSGITSSHVSGGTTTAASTGPASGLSYSFIALGDIADGVAFSDDGGVTFNYEPQAGANGVDTAVNAIRINPKGVFGAGAGGNPKLQLVFRMMVQ